jgi:hypothetical protein
VKRFLFALGIFVLPGLARAQVIVHQAALDQLAGVAAPVPVVVHKFMRKPAVRRHVAVRRVHEVVVPAVIAAKPVVAAAPPPAVTAPAEPFMPEPPTGPPVQVAVAKPAPALPPRPGAVVLHFAAGGSDVPGDAAVALRPICAAAKSDGFVDIDAYAPADKADPSAAMRLSLSRAFAVREVLIGCGLPLARIAPRADGAAGAADTARISIENWTKN